MKSLPSNPIHYNEIRTPSISAVTNLDVLQTHPILGGPLTGGHWAVALRPRAAPAHCPLTFLATVRQLSPGAPSSIQRSCKAARASQTRNRFTIHTVREEKLTFHLTLITAGKELHPHYRGWLKQSGNLLVVYMRNSHRPALSHKITIC